MVENDPGLVGKTLNIWVPADDDVDMLLKGYILRDVPESSRRLSDFQLELIDTWEQEGRVKKSFNTTFFTALTPANLNLPVSWVPCPDQC